MEQPIEERSFVTRNIDRLRQIFLAPMRPAVVMWYAFIVITLALLGYWINFSLEPYLECHKKAGGDCDFWYVSGSTTMWGEFGDFFGGTVNPVLGFLTICLLVSELRESRRAAERAEVAHRSTERALNEQLKEAKSQNNFANYYKHLEEFYSYVKSYLESMKQQKYTVLVVAMRNTHRMLYPSARDGGLTIDRAARSKLTRNLREFLQVLIDLESTEPEEIKKMCEDIRKIANNLEKEYNGKVTFSSAFFGHSLPHHKSISALHLIFLQLNYIYSFDVYYDDGEIMECLNFIDKLYKLFPESFGDKKSEYSLWMGESYFKLIEEESKYMVDLLDTLDK